MKKFALIITVALFSNAAAAYSNINCNTFGNTTTCSGTVNGKYVTERCTTFGNTTNCSRY